MKKLDKFEWLLICLIIATFAVGIFVALNRQDEQANHFIYGTPGVASISY